MFLRYARSAWEYVKLKIKITIYKWMHRKELRKVLEESKRKVDYNSGRTGRRKLSKVTISSQTEIGKAEVSIKVPKQRAYTGREPIISSSLADIPCCCLGIQGLLNLLNSTLGTSYTLDTGSLSSVLEDCIAKNYDFGTAYGRLRKTWDCGDIQKELLEREARDIKRRQDAVVGSRIVNPHIDPRRVWDLYSNRVVPWWCCEVGFNLNLAAQSISHAWVDGVDRVDVWAPINGCEWPVPIPKGASLDLIRIEMLNLGAEYTWLDVLCLRQRGGPREDLRVEEWKLDVPTIGSIYCAVSSVVYYLSGLGLPLSLKEGDLESDRSWFRRAWTVQEVGGCRTIAGDTPDGPMHAKLIDEAGNYDKILTKFYKHLLSIRRIRGVYGALSAMQNRISTYPIDKVAGLAFSSGTHSIPAYNESQSLEDAWTALVNEMYEGVRGILFVTYPEPGTGCKKWRPSWEQVMEKPLPKDYDYLGMGVKRDDDDWYEGLCIESGFVRGLAVEGEEGIDRCGELLVKGADGIAHIFSIAASHQYPIPDATYTLHGEHTLAGKQNWVIGRRLPNMMFEKVSVFQITDPDEGKRLEKLGLAAMHAMSRSILA